MVVLDGANHACRQPVVPPARCLELYVQKQAVPYCIDDFLQCGNLLSGKGRIKSASRIQLFQFGEGSPPDRARAIGGSLQVKVVDDHQLPVA